MMSHPNLLGDLRYACMMSHACAILTLSAPSCAPCVARRGGVVMSKRGGNYMGPAAIKWCGQVDCDDKQRTRTRQWLRTERAHRRADLIGLKLAQDEALLAEEPCQ